MFSHHLQRAIIYQLAFMERARFTDLKPDDIENKLFTYHLKKTLSSGLVAKDEHGEYFLTPEGRRYSTGARVKDASLIVERAHSVLFLVIRRKSDGAWLLYTRKTHPMLGYSGLPHANPHSEQDICDAAQQQCRERTGLHCTFRPLGSGFTKIIKDNALESYTHFTLLACDDAQGELTPNDPKADYFWELTPDFTDPLMFPTSQKLFEAYASNVPFFLEATYTI